MILEDISPVEILAVVGELELTRRKLLAELNNALLEIQKLKEEHGADDVPPSSEEK